MKTKVYIFTFFAFIVFFNKQTYGQQSTGFPCGSTEAHKKLYKDNPQLEADYQKFMNENKAFMNLPRIAASTIYTIPVVFHIIHEYGSEDISDAQVFNEMTILNRDYQLLNADITDVVPEFQALVGNVHFQFVLATKDPSGNCTNGIEHIYSHETRNGDDNSKLQQWPRSMYLNVWVVDSMSGGKAGYAYYPSAVAGGGYYIDGVMILNDYIGSNGTSSVLTSRALTHEIGHFFGLSHPWGNTNDPGVACGDDGIEDTPVTKGWDHCDLVHSSVCDSITGTVENVQNYMDYSYCSRMFTLDQASYMNSTLHNPTSFRDNLWSALNLSNTGADVTSPPTCTPVADFAVNTNFVCAGTSVTFSNHSWRGAVTSYSWSFPGGTPATSTAANPTVVYTTPGDHDVTLTVSNSAGSATTTKSNFISTSEHWADYVGPHSEDFENTEFDFRWHVLNPENNGSKWKQVNNAGYSGTNCIGLVNFVSPTPAFYYERMGKTVDAFVSPLYDLSHTTAASLSFKYSCATSASHYSEITEALSVYASTNCGATWTRLKVIAGNALTNAHNWSGVSYVANTQQYWDLVTIPLSSAFQHYNVRFKFEYSAGDKSNNMYIDDINLEGVLDAPDAVQSPFTMEVFPNPSLQSAMVSVSCFLNKVCDLQVVVTDLAGRQMASVNQRGVLGKQTIDMDNSELRLSAGMYFVTVKAGDVVQTKKVTIL